MAAKAKPSAKMGKDDMPMKGMPLKEMPMKQMPKSMPMKMGKRGK